jgi:hypothetical protein
MDLAITWSRNLIILEKKKPNNKLIQNSKELHKKHVLKELSSVKERYVFFAELHQEKNIQN